MIVRKAAFAALIAVLGMISPVLAQGQFPANTYWGNPTNAQALPRTAPWPSCPSGALNYTNGTGVGCAASVPASSIAVGGTTITGGNSTRVLFDNAGVLGEYTNAQLTALINLATASTNGALPAWPNNTTTYFRGDGTYPTLNCAALSGVGTGCAAAAGITALTGDVAATGPGSSAATLATVNSNVGTFGSSTQCVTLTVNAKGLVTGASATTCAPAFSSITGRATLAQLPSLTPGQIYQVPANGSAGAPSAVTARTLLTATTTFYVNGSNSVTSPCGANTCQPGSDSNNCASFSTPCQTIQHSLAVMAQNYDFGGQSVSLQLADGTYNECVLLPPYVTTNASDKNVFILGHSGSAGNVIVNCTAGSSNAFTAVNAPQGWYIQNLTVNATNNGIDADYFGHVYISGVAFNSVIANDMSAHNIGAFIEPFGSYSTTGNKSCHASASFGGEVIWSNITLTINGSPTYSSGLFCQGYPGIIVDTFGPTISGSFSGPKYNFSGRPVLFNSGITASTQNATQYVGLGSISNSLNNYYTLVNPSAKIVDLFVNTTAAPAAGQTFTFTLLLGGSPTALTCQISNPATSCSDQTHATNAVSGNTNVVLQMVSSATSGTAIVSASAVQQ